MKEFFKLVVINGEVKTVQSFECDNGKLRYGLDRSWWRDSAGGGTMKIDNETQAYALDIARTLEIRSVCNPIDLLFGRAKSNSLRCKKGKDYIIINHPEGFKKLAWIKYSGPEFEEKINEDKKSDKLIIEATHIIPGDGSFVSPIGTTLRGDHTEV